MKRLVVPLLVLASSAASAQPPNLTPLQQYLYDESGGYVVPLAPSAPPSPVIQPPSYPSLAPAAGVVSPPASAPQAPPVLVFAPSLPEQDYDGEKDGHINSTLQGMNF